jgi:hypothetical protein
MHEISQDGEEVRHEIFVRQPATIRPRLGDASLVDTGERTGLIQQRESFLGHDSSLVQNVAGAGNAGTWRCLIAELARYVDDRLYQGDISVIQVSPRFVAVVARAATLIVFLDSV